MTFDRTNVLGIGVSAINLSTAIDTIDDWIASGTRSYVCVTGVHGVMESQQDVELRQVYNNAGLVTPDGMPLVWLNKLHGHQHVDRVYGPDLMLALCDHSQTTGYRHFLYGGQDGVPELLADRLIEQFPQVQIVGTYSPPFRTLSDEEDEEIVEMINQTGAEIVWVGLGAPKQERWMATHVGRLDAAALIGVGAAFDFHAGLKPQAPRWMQRSGLEWFFRLSTEPRRLWKRYLIHNPSFIASVILQETGLRRYPLD